VEQEAKAKAAKQAEAEAKAAKQAAEEKVAKQAAEEKPWTHITAAQAAEAKAWIRGRIVRWLPDRAFGFMKVAGTDIFVHMGSIRGDISNVMNQDVVARIVADVARGPDKFKATEVRRETEHIEEEAILRATKAAAETAYASEEARKRAVISRDATEAASMASQTSRITRPPGLMLKTQVPPERNFGTTFMSISTQTNNYDSTDQIDSLTPEEAETEARKCMTNAKRLVREGGGQRVATHAKEKYLEAVEDYERAIEMTKACPYCSHDVNKETHQAATKRCEETRWLAAEILGRCSMFDECAEQCRMIIAAKTTPRQGRKICRVGREAG
jgi:cold shock CspA family protein